MSSPDQLDWAEDPHGRILMGQFGQLSHKRKIPQDLVVKTRTPPPTGVFGYDSCYPRPLVHYTNQGQASR